MTGLVDIPTPPRLTGDLAADVGELHSYVSDLYRSMFLAQGVVKTNDPNAEFGGSFTGAAATTMAAGLNEKLNKAGGDILTGVMDVDVTTYDGGIRVGDVAWDSSTGTVTSGSGVVTTRLGLLGAANGTTNFTLSATDGGITARLGTIGGLSLDATSLSATAGGNTTTFSSGATSFSSGPTGSPTVTITQAGALTATGVNISGTLTASAGTIGGFTLGATTLTATSGGNTTIVSSGATAFSSGPTGSPTVTITQAGAINASNLTVTGGTVYVSGTSTVGGLSGAVYGDHATLYGVIGRSAGAGYAGVYGGNTAGGYGVYGISSGIAIYGVTTSSSGAGVKARGAGAGYLAMDALDGNIRTDQQLVSTVATGTAPLVVSSTTQVTNLYATQAATVTGAAQTAITSLGTLTGLAIAGNVNAGSAWTHMIGYPNPFSVMYALTHYGYSMLMPEDTTGTVYNDNASLGQISIHQTHNLAAAKYKLGSVPGTGTPPFMYFNIGGKVCLFVDATGAGTAC